MTTTPFPQSSSDQPAHSAGTVPEADLSATELRSSEIVTQAPQAVTEVPEAVTEVPVEASAPEDSSSASTDGVASAPTASASVATIEFGRLDEQGNVFVIDNGTERLIGGFPDGAPEDPFALYTRRYADLEATIKLFEDRLPQLSPKDIDSTLATLRTAVAEPAAIGDLPALRTRVDALAVSAEQRKEQARAERQAAKSRALEERTALIERVEELVAQDPERTHWKQSGQALRDLLEEWKAQQRRGPRLDKAAEDELWKRFSSARTVFDRHRRQFFSALDQRQAEAHSIKEELIQEAESLQNSTEWGPTSGAYRDLMDRWKSAPRASRKEDDALWARFRAAQQVFFDARRAKDEATDSEYEENLVAKEELLTEAEALLPVTDLAATKAKLRSIEDRWDEIGRVPSSDLSKVERRMRAVEDAVRGAEEQEWKRSNPETRARAAGMVGQLEDQVASLEEQLSQAEASGDAGRTIDLRDALTTKKAWLDQILSSME